MAEDSPTLGVFFLGGWLLVLMVSWCKYWVYALSQLSIRHVGHIGNWNHTIYNLCNLPFPSWSSTGLNDEVPRLTSPSVLPTHRRPWRCSCGQPIARCQKPLLNVKQQPSERPNRWGLSTRATGVYFCQKKKLNADILELYSEFFFFCCSLCGLLISYLKNSYLTSSILSFSLHTFFEHTREEVSILNHV